MLAASTRITDIRPQNRIKMVTKQADGGLMVELHSGQTFTLDKDDELFQAFVVYSVLAEL